MNMLVTSEMQQEVVKSQPQAPSPTCSELLFKKLCNVSGILYNVCRALVHS